MNKLRLVGDEIHAASVLWFFVIARCKGNAAGMSLKAQELYLLAFVMRYMDLLITFYSWYNTCMKVFFILITAMTVYALRNVEPAKSTYSRTQDSFSHWSILVFTGIVAMVIHLIGSGVVDIKGGSGEEFEVHFEKYEWFSFLWTFSICLEPFAMLPQLYIFRKNRLVSWDVRGAICLKGLYRLFYIINWMHVSKFGTPQHHVLVYIAGALQVLMYTDFFLYHLR
jgi:ER lumen protein retaining receptor